MRGRGRARKANDAVLDPFRGPGRCELCGRWCRREPHHIYPKGMGGDRGGKLNFPGNILALCRPCHDLAQQYRPPRKAQLALAAAREGCTPEAITERVHLLRRTR